MWNSFSTICLLTDHHQDEHSIQDLDTMLSRIKLDAALQMVGDDNDKSTYQFLIFFSDFTESMTKFSDIFPSINVALKITDSPGIVKSISNYFSSILFCVIFL